jgi:hypothetical protein
LLFLVITLMGAPSNARADSGEVGNLPTGLFGATWAVGNTALSVINGLCIARTESPLDCGRAPRIRWLLGGTALVTGAVGIVFGSAILTDDSLRAPGWRALAVADLVTGAAAIVAGTWHLTLGRHEVSVAPRVAGLAVVGRF